MLSDPKHIDDLFRKKEAESAINTAAADRHWQQMKDLLPSSKPGKIITILKYAAVIVIIAGAAFISISVFRKKERSFVIAKPEKNIPAIHDYAGPDHNQTNNNQVLKNDTMTLSRFSQLIKNDKKEKQVSVNINNDNKPPQTIIAGLEDSHEKNLSVFNKFYQQLEKPAQVFVINGKQDTIIHCKEGTTLFVPAGSFQTLTGLAITGIIRIYVKEFYSFADIITNKLTTLSNGQPLSSGGMVHIKAQSNNEELMLQPGKKLDLSMPAGKFDPQMQLFVADKEKDDLNWIATGQRQAFFKENHKLVTVLNTMDNPYDVVFKDDKTIGKFFIPYNCVLSTDEMEEILMKKYARRYDVIKVRREWKPIFKKNRIGYVKDWYKEGVVGDSLYINIKIAAKYKLISREDSIKYEAKFKKEAEDQLKWNTAYKEYLEIREKYNFKIAGLGWINCDRFINYPPGKLNDLILTTTNGFKDTYFQAMMIIPKENSAMPGYWLNGKIYFSNLPEGKKLDVICVGTKNGKVYACIQQFTNSPDENKELKFEETTPEQFKEKLRRFGKVSS